MYLHTKYEPCNLESVEDLGKHQVFRQGFGETEQLTDEQTYSCKKYAPDLSIQEHKIYMALSIKGFETINTSNIAKNFQPFTTQQISDKF